MDNEVSIFPNLFKSPKIINYLHGRIDKESSWIFTRGQYNQGYVLDSAPCLEFLTNIFENYSVLFVGYGFREDEIMRPILLSQNRKSYWWLDGFSENNQNFMEIRKTSLGVNYGIDLIPYSIENEGHPILNKVLQELYKALIKRRA